MVGCNNPSGVFKIWLRLFVEYTLVKPLFVYFSRLVLVPALLSS